MCSLRHSDSAQRYLPPQPLHLSTLDTLLNALRALLTPQTLRALTSVGLRPQPDATWSQPPARTLALWPETQALRLTRRPLPADQSKEKSSARPSLPLFGRITSLLGTTSSARSRSRSRTLRRPSRRTTPRPSRRPWSRTTYRRRGNALSTSASSPSSASPLRADSRCPPLVLAPRCMHYTLARLCTV